MIREKISAITAFGLVIVIAAIATTSSTSPKTDIAEIDEGSRAKGMLMITIYAIIAALSISVEVLINNWLKVHRDVNGDIVGIYVLLVEGIIGTACFIVSTLMGKGLYLIGLHGFGFILLAAIFLYAGIIIANFALSIGVAAVCLAILNSNAALHVILSAIFLHQDITGWQIVGVIFTIVGATIVSLGDIIFSKK